MRQALLRPPPAAAAAGATTVPLLLVLLLPLSALGHQLSAPLGRGASCAIGNSRPHHHHHQVIGGGRTSAAAFLQPRIIYSRVTKMMATTTTKTVEVVSPPPPALAVVAAPSRPPPPRVLVDARQLSREEVAARFPDTDFDVPHSLREALAVFFSHSSILFIVAGLLALASARLVLLGSSPLTLADGVAVPVVVGGWVVQEWAIHKYLLHGLPGWMGHDIHQQHHERPFFHVSIDPPPIVLAWGAVFCSLCWMVLQPLGASPGLRVTIMTVYWLMGLAYEWAHFIVHTKVQPTSTLGKAIKQHHTRHHLTDERYWYAFTWPGIDDIMGTTPTTTTTTTTTTRRGGRGDKTTTAQGRPPRQQQ